MQFFVSSTCFEHHAFIIRKNICTCNFIWYVFHAEIKIKVYIKYLNIKC